MIKFKKKWDQKNAILKRNQINGQKIFSFKLGLSKKLSIWKNMDLILLSILLIRKIYIFQIQLNQELIMYLCKGINLITQTATLFSRHRSRVHFIKSVLLQDGQDYKLMTLSPSTLIDTYCTTNKSSTLKKFIPWLTASEIQEESLKSSLSLLQLLWRQFRTIVTFCV